MEMLFRWLVGRYRDSITWKDYYCLTVERNYKGNAEIMGKKIQCIGRYVMDGVTLGKGNFAKVELATHSVTGCKVSWCCF